MDAGCSKSHGIAPAAAGIARDRSGSHLRRPAGARDRVRDRSGIALISTPSDPERSRAIPAYVLHCSLHRDRPERQLQDAESESDCDSTHTPDSLDDG